MRLVVTHRVEQSIRILKYLAAMGCERASAQEIATALELSPDSVRQVMRALSKADLVTSQPGPNGGYWLNCAPQTTSIKLVIEASEGVIDPSFCGLRKISCEAVTTCAIHSVWSSAQASLTHELTETSLADVLESARP